MLEDKDLVSIQEVRTKVEKAYAAWQKYRPYSQAQVDAIVERMAAAGRANAERLAAMAVEETGYGNVKDKIAKNLLNADLLPRKMRGMRTIGMLREIPEERIVEYAVPVGVVAAILPTTNPTSTAIYKILISLKAGNAIVLSPHPRAVRCTCATADLLYRAALEAGAPEDIIQCLGYASLDGTNALMRHERTGVILSTGGHGIVRAAYSSGKPAFGVGPGNVPVMIERTADVPDAIAKVIEGKSFDYGTVCSSEQAIVVEDALKERVLAELKAGKAHFCNAEQKQALGEPAGDAELDHQSRVRGTGAHQDRDHGGLHGSAGDFHPGGRIGWRGQAASAFHGEAFAGAGSLLGEGFRRRDEHLRKPAAFRRVGPHLRDLLDGRRADSRVRATHAGQSRAGEYAHAARFHRHHHECVPFDDAGLRRGGGQHHQRQRGSAASVQHQAAGLRSAHAGGGVRDIGGGSGCSGAGAGTVGGGYRRSLSGAPGSGRIAMRRPVAPSAPQEVAAAPTPSCACQTPAPAPPKPQIVDFVCEEDVRNAIKQSRKIYIGPKTIVTPSARDLASPSDILVLA